MKSACFSLFAALLCFPLSVPAQTSVQTGPTSAVKAHVQQLLLRCDDTYPGGGGGYDPASCYLWYLNAGNDAVERRNWGQVITEEADAIEILAAYPQRMRTTIGRQGNITVSGMSVPYIYRAIAYAKNKQYVLAITDDTEAIALDPLSSIPWNERCWNHAVAGDLSAALQDCQKSLQIAPKSADTLDPTGFVYLKMKNYPAVAMNYQEALKIKPRLASSLYGLGLAEQAQGDQIQGGQHIAAAQQIDPKITTDFGT